jgi:enterobactin synthetase component D
MKLLSSVLRISINAPNGATAYGMEINVAGYCDSMFEDNGVNPPDWLQRATKNRKAEYLCGRVLARYALSFHGYGNCQVPADENRCPVWPIGISGSISHTEGYAICVIGKSGEMSGVGVDIEAPFDLITYQCTSQVFATAEETEYLVKTFPQEDLGWIGAAIYSSKESIFKCLYPRYGQYFDFKEAVLVEIMPNLIHHRYQLSPEITPANENRSIINVSVSEFRNLIVTSCSS